MARRRGMRGGGRCRRGALGLFLLMAALIAPAGAWELDGGHAAMGTVASTRWLFAEGFTGDGFSEYLTIGNFGDQPAAVTVAFSLSGAGKRWTGLVVGARSRATVDVDEVVGKGFEVAADVRADRPIVAERSVYMLAKVGAAGRVSGGHAGPGATEARTRWLFAEGFTGAGFQEYVTVLNPDGEPAHVRLRFSTPSGRAYERAVDVAAGSRATVDVNGAVGVGQEVALVAESDKAVVVERPVYFHAAVGAAGEVNGTHAVLGASEASPRWLFAEGFTGSGFQEYLTVFNPGPVATGVTVELQFAGASPRRIGLAVAAGSRQTFDVNGVAPGRELSAALVADQPVVAERVAYFHARVGEAGVVDGGHAVVGASAPQADWYFAEGYTAAGYAGYITISNPGDVAAYVPVESLAAGVPPQRRDVQVGAHERATLNLRDLVGGDREASFHVGPASAPVVAERSMYFRHRVRRQPPDWITHGVASRLPTDQRVVALTFDGGANDAGVAKALVGLAGRPATFFLTGDFIARQPGSAQAIASTGNRIANHSRTHRPMVSLDDASVRAEIADTDAAIARLGADPLPVFRFPYGTSDRRTEALVASMGFGQLGWTTDTAGWLGTSGGWSRARVVGRALDNLGPGEIVLMHLGSNPTDGTTLDVDALPEVIARTEAAGYRFVSLEDFDVG